MPYLSAGADGRTVILVHGGASDRYDWTKNIATLARSHRVYAPNLIGFGRDSRRDSPYTVQHFSAFLRDFMDTLGLEKALLVGHSLGGRASLEVARRAPERIERLVLVAPIGFGRLSVPGLVLGTAAWALFKLTRRPLPYPPLDVRLKEANLQVFRQVEVPTLVLWGRWDPYFPPRYARRVQQPIPNSLMKLFSFSGHSPHRHEPSKFNRVLLHFFSGRFPYSPDGKGI